MSYKLQPERVQYVCDGPMREWFINPSNQNWSNSSINNNDVDKWQFLIIYFQKKVTGWIDLQNLSQFSNVIGVILDTHSIQIKASNHRTQELCFGQDILVVFISWRGKLSSKLLSSWAF